ncbi:hypothetical protein VAWG005_34310 [Aeromonas dhakensis]|nr:hypothetical protein VAWG003_34290 [Aeromonas dhakensis]BEE27503.1 hypothetical protein VAWG005_34310 [Aeromonas dhakensis]
MQVAHGGHECDGAPFTAPLADLFTQSGGIVNDQHQLFTFEKIKERRAGARADKREVSTRGIIIGGYLGMNHQKKGLTLPRRAKRGRRPPLSSRHHIS